MPTASPESTAGEPRKRAGGAPRGNSNARKHGLSTLKRTVRELGSRAVDRRTSVGKALAAWRAELIDDHGGMDALSTAELALIDEAVVTKLLLGSVNAWLLEQGNRLVNKRRGALVQAVRDRSALVRELRETLTKLGVRRRPARGPSFDDIKKRYAERKQRGAGVDAETEPGASPRLATHGAPGLSRDARSVPGKFPDDSENPPHQPDGVATEDHDDV